MNGQITRLAVGTIVLLSALIVGTTYWQTFAVAGLADRQDNALARVATVHRRSRKDLRGATVASLLATNVKTKVAGQTYYFRKYPNGYLAPHIVGYSTQSRSRAGIERSQNDYLTGANGDISSVTQRELDKLTGVTIKGNDLHLTLNPRAQQTAVRALRGKCGAAVAIEPQTGRILAIASSPTYNPNAVEKSFSAITRIRTAACPFAAPLLDRATQGLYPPGSTFKVVTASAALDSGAFKPDVDVRRPGLLRGVRQARLERGQPREPGDLRHASRSRRGCSTRSTRCSATSARRSARARSSTTRERYGFYASPDARAARGRAEPERAVPKHKLVRAEASRVPGRPRPARVRAGAAARDAAADGDGRGDRRERRRR